MWNHVQESYLKVVQRLPISLFRYLFEIAIYMSKHLVTKYIYEKKMLKQKFYVKIFKENI